MYTNNNEFINHNFEETVTNIVQLLIATLYNKCNRSLAYTSFTTYEFTNVSKLLIESVNEHTGVYVQYDFCEDCSNYSELTSNYALMFLRHHVSTYIKRLKHKMGKNKCYAGYLNERLYAAQLILQALPGKELPYLSSNELPSNNPADVEHNELRAEYLYKEFVHNQDIFDSYLKDNVDYKTSYKDKCVFIV